MKNKLTDLNDHLFAQLERLSNDKLDVEGIEREASRTEAIVNVSAKIIDGARLSFDAAKLVAEKGVGNWEFMLPGGLEGKIKGPGLPDYSKEEVKKR